MKILGLSVGDSFDEPGYGRAFRSSTKTELIDAVFGLQPCPPYPCHTWSHAISHQSPHSSGALGRLHPSLHLFALL